MPVIGHTHLKRGRLDAGRLSIYGPATSWDTYCGGTQFGDSFFSTLKREFLSSENGGTLMNNSPLQSFKQYVWITLCVALLVASGCALQFGVPEKEPIRKTIVSHAGELERDTRFVGGKVQFKIYYKNKTNKTVNIGIIDKLDSSLKDIKVYSSGWHDKTHHTVIWQLKKVKAGATGSVMFEAILSQEKTVHNKAMVLLGAKKMKGLQLAERDLPTVIRPLGLAARDTFETNTVKVIVKKKPKLGWVPFAPDFKEGERVRSTMKDETTMDIMINFDVPGMYVKENKVDGITYHQLSMPMHANRMEIGKPQVPIAGRIIEVPLGVYFEVEIVKKKSINLGYYNVMPAQEPEIRKPPLAPVAKKFTLDKKTYSKAAMLPGKLSVVTPEDIGIIRGHRLLFLKAYPVQFNPTTKEVTAYSQVEVKLKFNKPAQIQAVQPRVYSPAFEDVLRKMVINYKDVERFERNEGARRNKEEDCDYLILTHGDFYNATDANNPLVRFAEWKRQKGYITRVVDLADIPAGQDAEDIRDYIQNAYDTWYPVPTYVLLVGDAEFLPTNYERADGTDIEHDANAFYNGANLGTDLYYATVDGTDHYPDIFLGRISVDTLAETTDVIDKILAYEQNPPATPANADFYTDTSLVQLFEDDGTGAEAVDGREDATFRIVEFAEEIRTFLQNNGYTAPRIYDQSGAFANGPLRYEDGTNLPAALTIAGGFPWTGGTADITNAINNGNFLVTYDGHGLRDLWDRPGFDNGDINALANGTQTPFVLSLACETGWFDNETDDDALLAAAVIPSNTANNAESFSETFLRHNNGGAVGIIGASRISYEENDFMMLGMITAIWPEFDPNPPLRGGVMPEFETGMLRRLGQINTLSKIFMAMPMMMINCSLRSTMCSVIRKCRYGLKHRLP